MDNLLERSADFQAMMAYWQKVNAITSGVELLRNERYLPKFVGESDENYQNRRDSSTLVDVFGDITESLASKPFANEAGLADEDVSEPIHAFIENVDLAGNHFHVFAHDTFLHGIDYALDWILVDYPSLPAGATLADERRLGARPYFVRIKAENMLEVRTADIGGEQFVYVRIDESYVEGADIIERVRVIWREEADGNYGRPQYEVQEAREGGWTVVDEGVLSIGEIPLVPFYTGRRKSGSWQFTLPMKRVADLQIEHYQETTNLKLAKQKTAFPMFEARGINPQMDENGKPVKMPVGPSTVLYAPPDREGRFGQWNVLEPSTTSLQFLSKEIDKLESQMRELGRQPLTAGTAGLTQVAAAFASQRSSSAVQAWAYNLKDAFEKALSYVALWYGLPDAPKVYIDTDFAIEVGDDKAPDMLLQLYQDSIISAQTLLRELKRRGILSPEFSEQEEVDLMMNEIGSE